MNEGNRQIDPASRHKETAILTTASEHYPTTTTMNQVLSDGAIACGF